MYCPNCGASNADDATFCKSCGTKLAESGTQTPNAPSVPTGKMNPRLMVTSAFKSAIALVKNPVGYMNQNRAAVPTKPLMMNYVGILAIVPFIATLIGDLWYFAHANKYAFAIPGAILAYVLEVVGVIVLGVVIWKLGPSFGTNTTQAMATTLSAYVYTPGFLISIVYIIPQIGLLTILGLLYGLYIFYKGVPILLNTPQDRVLVYVIVVVIVALVIGIVFTSIAQIATTALFHG